MMTDFGFANEFDQNREARDALLDEEAALRTHIEPVAEQQRQLPDGGRLKEDCAFARLLPAGGSEKVAFAGHFGSHDSLILHTMVFGPDWDVPCSS